MESAPAILLSSYLEEENNCDINTDGARVLLGNQRYGARSSIWHRTFAFWLAAFSLYGTVHSVVES